MKAHLLRGQLELVSCGLLSDAMDLEAAVVGEFAENPSGDNVVESIEQMVERCKRKAQTLDVRLGKTKNLVEYRRVLVSEFFRYCHSGGTKCPHCSAPYRGFKQENQVRIFLRPLQKKHSTSWTEVMNREIRKTHEMMAEVARLRGERGEEEEEGDATQLPGRTNLGDPDSLPGLMKTEECLIQTFVSPLKVREHVRQLWTNERLVMETIFNSSSEMKGEGGEMFFLDAILVPPSRFRPVRSLCYIILIHTLAAQRLEVKRLSNSLHV